MSSDLVELRLTDVGEGLVEAELVEWLVEVGDLVTEGQSVCAIETDKSEVELPAPASGSVSRILVSPGDRIQVGAALLEISTTDAADEISIEGTPEAVQEQPYGGLSDSETEGTRSRSDEMDVGVENVHEKGSVHVDEAAGESLGLMREQIASNLTEAWQEVPHVTDMRLLDIEELMRMREALRPQGKMSGLLSSLLRATALALQEQPKLNGTLPASRRWVASREVNIGIAVATARGLVVPVLRGVESMGVWDVDKATSDLVEAARAGNLPPTAYREGTFTVSNAGTYGAEFGTPIIRRPEVGLLVFGSARKRPTVVENRVVARWTLPVTLAADHRVVDGSDMGVFMNALTRILSAPEEVTQA